MKFLQTQTLLSNTIVYPFHSCAVELSRGLGDKSGKKISFCCISDCEIFWSNFKKYHREPHLSRHSQFACADANPTKRSPNPHLNADLKKGSREKLPPLSKFEIKEVSGKFVTLLLILVVNELQKSDYQKV